VSVRRWVWCGRCERCHEVALSREPATVDGVAETPWDLRDDIAPQLRTDASGKVRCHYDDCDGAMPDLWWWSDYRDTDRTAPEAPEPGTVYTMYA